MLLSSQREQRVMSVLGRKQTLQPAPCKLPHGGSADDQFRVRLLAARDPARPRAGGGIRRPGASREGTTSSSDWLGDGAACHLDDNADGAVLAGDLAHARRAS